MKTRIHRLIFRAFHLIPHRGFSKKNGLAGGHFFCQDIKKQVRKLSLGASILKQSTIAAVDRCGCVLVKSVTEGSTNNVTRFYPAVRIRRDQMFIENYPAVARWQKVPAGSQHK